MAKTTINKAKQIREALSLTPTEAGQILFGYTPKQSRDTWMQWENKTKKPSRPTEKFFDVILELKKAEKLKTKNCHGALKMVLLMLRPDDDLD